MPDANATAVFPLLQNPDRYRPCPYDLRPASEHKTYWLNLFRQHFPGLLKHAIKDADDRGAPPPPVQEATERFFSWLQQAEREPCPLERLDILTICYERERVLRGLGIPDPYRLAKQQQNQRCLAVLPKLLGELDAVPEDVLNVAVIQGVFAGNIFDLGAPETIALFEGGGVDFDHVRAALKPRPWLVDHMDAWLQTLKRKTHRCAVLFVDNAGPDICLGMIPFARYLIQRGTRVILTANREPSLNDVTIDELDALIDRVCDLDAVVHEAVAAGELQLVCSGNNAPLIDLGRVSPELAETCEKEAVDLVVLEGMGRGIESNFDAELSCDTLKIAMLKDLGVTRSLGGELYDLVFRFDPAKT